MVKRLDAHDIGHIKADLRERGIKADDIEYIITLIQKLTDSAYYQGRGDGFEAKKYDND